MKPIYTHDCTNCQFLGTALVEGKWYDLYYCSGEPTVIARYSSEGSEYASGLSFGMSALARAIKGEKFASKALMVAYTMAMANGLDLTDKFANKGAKTVLEMIQNDN